MALVSVHMKSHWPKQSLLVWAYGQRAISRTDLWGVWNPTDSARDACSTRKCYGEDRESLTELMQLLLYKHIKYVKSIYYYYEDPCASKEKKYRQLSDSWQL